MSPAVTKKYSSSSSYATQGDIANAAILSLSLVYAGTVIYYTQPNQTGVLDEAWRQDGFCVHNKNVPYWSSFDTCLYVDVVFSAVLGILHLLWRKVPGMETSSALAPLVIMGTLGHGLAHGKMAEKYRQIDDSNINNGDTAPEERQLWQYVVFATVFWYPLLQASMMSVTRWKVACLAGMVTYGGSFLADQYGFTYVQTILACAYHGSQLWLLPAAEKERREYLMLPLLAALVPLLTAWNEVLFCTAYFRAAGGHVLYDASIILCFIAYYVDCYWYHSSFNKQEQEKTKKQM